MRAVLLALAFLIFWIGTASANFFGTGVGPGNGFFGTTATGGSQFVGPGDVTGNAFLAWWSCTRAYSFKTTKTAACDLQRASDSATCIGVKTLPNGNLDINAGLYCTGATQTVRQFASGTTVRVTKLYDQASGLLSLTTASFATSPLFTLSAINGQPAMTCQAANSTIIQAAVGTTSTPLSIAAEAEQTTNNGNFTFPLESGGDAVAFTFDDSPNLVHMDAGGAIPSTSVTAFDGQPHALIGSVTAGANASNLNVDGTDFPGTSGGTQVATAIAMCGGTTGVGFFDGYSAEAGYAATAFNSTLRTALSLNMDTYYTLTDATQVVSYTCLKRIWITPTGTSSGPGTSPANGFDTFAHLQTTASITPGTCIDYLAGNTYNDTIQLAATTTGSSNSLAGFVVFESVDSNGNPVNAATHTVLNSGAAKIVNSFDNGNPTIGISSTTTAPSFIGINGLEITSKANSVNFDSCFNNHGVGTWDGLDQFGPDHWFITNTYMHDCPGAGIAELNGHFYWIQNNVIKNTAYLDQNAQSAITIANPKARRNVVLTGNDNAMPWKILISGNYLYNSTEWGVTTANLSQNRTDAEDIILDNWSESQCAGSSPGSCNAGLYQYPAIVVNNVGYNSGGNCLQYNSVWYTTAINNTCINNGLDLANVGTSHAEFLIGNGNYNYIYNNVAFSPGPWTFVTQSLTGASIHLPVNDIRGVSQFIKNIAVSITMVWSATNGGQITIVAATPAPVAEIGDVVFIGGGTNAGTGGDGAVAGNFTVTAFTDNQHFIVAAPAAAGVITTIGGTPAINPFSLQAQLPTAGTPIPVQVNGTAYSAIGYTVDVSNTCNAATAPGCVSGTITFASAVSQADGQQFNQANVQVVNNVNGGCTGPGAAQVPCSFWGYANPMQLSAFRTSPEQTCSGLVPGGCTIIFLTDDQGPQSVADANITFASGGVGGFSGLNSAVVQNTFGYQAQIGTHNVVADPAFISPLPKDFDAANASGDVFGPGWWSTQTGTTAPPNWGVIAAVSPAVGAGQPVPFFTNPSKTYVPAIDILGNARSPYSFNIGAYDNQGTPLAYTGIGDVGVPAPLVYYGTIAYSKALATGRQPALQINCNGDAVTSYVININTSGVLDDTAVAAVCPGWTTSASWATGTIATTVLTITGSVTGTIAVGQIVTGAGVTTGTKIVSFGTGVGGIGTYNLSAGSTVAVAEAMSAANTVSVQRVFEQVRNNRECDLLQGTAASQPTLKFNNVSNKDALQFSGTQFLQLAISNGDQFCGVMFSQPSYLTVAESTFGSGIAAVMDANGGDGTLGFGSATTGYWSAEGVTLTPTGTDQAHYFSLFGVGVGNSLPLVPSTSGFVSINDPSTGTTTSNSYGGTVWQNLFTWGQSQSGAAFTGSITGTTLTVTAVSTAEGFSVIKNGQTVTGAGVTGSSVILNQLSGTFGGSGTYQLSQSSTVVSEALTSSLVQQGFTGFSTMLAVYGTPLSNNDPNPQVRAVALTQPQAQAIYTNSLKPNFALP